MKKNDFIFFDKPEKLDKEAYDKARANILAYLSKIPDVISIYEYGSINHPGFSDLDIIVVLKNELKESSSEDFERTRFDSKTQKVMMGPLVILNKYIFSNLNRVMLVDRVFRLYGEKLKINELSKEEKLGVELSILIEFLPDRIFHFTDYVTSKKIPIRFSIGVCYSLKYSIQLIESLTGIKNKEWDSYVKTVNYLRKNWFTLNDEKYFDLVKCIKRGLTISYEIIRESTNYLTKNKYYVVSNLNIKNAILYQGSNKLIYFSKELSNADQKKSLELTKDMKRNWVTKHISKLNLLNQNVLCLPLIYYIHYLCYLNSEGIITDALSHSFIPKPRRAVIRAIIIDDKIKSVLKQRIEICNKYASFLIGNNFPVGSFIYTGFVYSKTRKLKNNILNLIASIIYNLNKQKAKNELLR